MRNHKDEGPPCKSMEDLLQQVADGSASGIKKAYALAHAAQCHRCGNFLDRMKVTLEVLSESKDTSDPSDALSRLRDKISVLESKSGQQ